MPNTKCPRNGVNIERERGRGGKVLRKTCCLLLYKTISIGLRVLGLWYFPTLRSLVLSVSSSALFANSFLMRSAQFSLTFANSCHKREQNKNKNKQKEKKNNANHKKVLFRTNFNYFLVVFCCCCGLFFGFYCIAGVAFKSVRCHALLAPTLTLTVCAKFEANI